MFKTQSVVLNCVFLTSAEVTSNVTASEETLSWLLDVIENDADPYVRLAQTYCHHSCDETSLDVCLLLSVLCSQQKNFLSLSSWPVLTLFVLINIYNLVKSN